MTLEKLTETVDKLHALLHDPHPGLFSWNMFLAERMNELAGYWSDRLEEQAKEHTT